MFVDFVGLLFPLNSIVAFSVPIMISLGIGFEAGLCISSHIVLGGGKFMIDVGEWRRSQFVRAIAKLQIVPVMVPNIVGAAGEAYVYFRHLPPRRFYVVFRLPVTWRYRKANGRGQKRDKHTPLVHAWLALGVRVLHYCQLIT